jgi:predicted polyphosphate/ATP-dependent NAD kinase
LATVGIIANPASGKDIRRLVAHGSVFDNHEKVNIVRRVLLGLEAAGVHDVLCMPDYFGIVDKALNGLKLSARPRPLDMRIRGNQLDSTEAARRMAEAGAGCIVTLGGDGTNRAVAKGSVAVPLMPISTGTNNVFPFMVEGTLAGLAAGVVATGAVSLEQATVPTNRFDVLFDGQETDLALVDIAVYDDSFVGSRAIWDMTKVREIFVAMAAPSHVGLSSISGCLHCNELNGRRGTHVRLAGEQEEAGLEVTAPVAPGLVRPVRVAGFRLLEVGEEVAVTLVPSVLALDGEREVEVGRKQRVSVRFSDRGPRVVHVERALQAATERRYFTSDAAYQADDRQCLLAHLGVCLNPCPRC